jgi:hypothetical protein
MSDWNCKGCNFLIYGSKDRCFKCNLDRNGDKVVQKRAGDWNCKGCGFLLYASKASCFKCKLNRKGDKVVQKRAGDWNCKGCGFLLYASKTSCFKCNLDKEGRSVKDFDNMKDDDLCIVCFSNPKNSVFIHGDEAHQSCCYACANQIKNKDNKCPLCRKTIDSVIKVF